MITTTTTITQYRPQGSLFVLLNTTTIIAVRQVGDYIHIFYSQQGFGQWAWSPVNGWAFLQDVQLAFTLLYLHLILWVYWLWNMCQMDSNRTLLMLNCSCRAFVPITFLNFNKGKTGFTSTGHADLIWCEFGWRTSGFSLTYWDLNWFSAFRNPSRTSLGQSYYSCLWYKCYSLYISLSRALCLSSPAASQYDNPFSHWLDMTWPIWILHGAPPVLPLHIIG